MHGMFHGATSFNSDLSKWDVSSVTEMRYMFHGGQLFNSDISNWDVSRVTTMWGMFYGATSFYGGISKWDVSSVISTGYMFFGASFNGDVSKWDDQANDAAARPAAVGHHDRDRVRVQEHCRERGLSLVGERPTARGPRRHRPPVPRPGKVHDRKP